MGFKKPFVNLLNGKKTECWFCKEQLILKETEFEMKQSGGTASISVTDELFFCQSCRRNYITKSKSLELVKKYPGYYVDVSLYDIRRHTRSVSAETANEIQIRSGGKKETHTSDCADVFRKCRTVNGYKIVPISSINKEAFKNQIILTSYPFEKCPSCGCELINYVNFVRISNTEVARTPGRLCMKCDTFFDEHGRKLKEVCDQSPYGGKCDLNLEYIVPNFSEQMCYIRSLQSATIAVHLKNKETDRHRIVTIVSARSDENIGKDVFHYRNLVARKILYSVYREDETINLVGSQYQILRIFQINRKNKDSLNRMKISKIVLRKGGGILHGIQQKNIDLLDILLYSPFTGCLEIAHASYDNENNIHYMDSKLFRAFVFKYGNPGIPIAAYQKGSRDFSTMREESLLHAYGYVVGNRGLADAGRHALLSEVLDLKLMTSYSILNLLDLNLTMHPGEKYAQARADWENDKEFVMEYKVNPERFVVATIGLVD